MKTNEEEVIQWLLNGDPSIRWQVLRDIVGADMEIVTRVRQQVATAGWGAKLLSLQDPAGRWGGQLYNNKWLSTTYTLLLLRQMGLEPTDHQAHLACKALLDGGYREAGGVSYAIKVAVIDNGVTGMVLSLLACFGYIDSRVHDLVEYLLGQQLPDGRWEPLPGNPQIRYTFDTTILILEGLHEYGKQYPGRAIRINDAQRRGREFLLCHKLYELERTGEIIDKKMLLFSFPPRWHYDVLVALDYFQDCNADRDERLGKAIDLLRAKRCQDGSWKLQNRHPGKTFFEMEAAGQPSRWNTLRALRVLDWWEGR